VSDDNLELVRHAYEVWNRDGPAAIEALLAPDVELHDAPQVPDADVWRGRAAAIARLRSVADAVGGGYVEFEDFVPRGDSVLVKMRWELGGEREPAELGEVFHLVEVAGGQIARIRVFLTEREARDA
jgi:ketosteroid isomerase-like protein